MTQDPRSATSEKAAHTAIIEVRENSLRFLTRKLGNAEEAQDVLHDFLARVLSRFDDVRDSEKLRGWMRRVLETTLIDHFRARSKRQRAEAGLQSLEEVPAGNLIQNDLDGLVCMCLHKLIPTLKPEHAEVLQRTDLMEEPREAVAASLGISEGNLRVRLHRARQALRQRLDETCQACLIRGFLDCGDDCWVGHGSAGSPSLSQPAGGNCNEFARIASN